MKYDFHYPDMFRVLYSNRKGMKGSSRTTMPPLKSKTILSILASGTFLTLIFSGIPPASLSLKS
jgi:hypothetical protein